MKTAVFLLLALRTTLGEESSYLSSVLKKIQRERLGLIATESDLDYHVDFNNNNKIESSDDYIYVDSTDDHSIDDFADNYSEGQTTFLHGVKASHNGKSEELSLPDSIYIYNDTIHLYKRPNSSITRPKMPIMSSGLPLQHNLIPYKVKLNPSSFTVENHDSSNSSDYEADDFIQMMVDEDGTKQDATGYISEGEEDGVKGYYYYYYNLDQIPPDIAKAVLKIASKPGNQVKPGMKPIKMPMPIKMMVKKAPKQPATPLFKAMAMFVGTAVMFILSILLMPRIKLVKAKSSEFDFGELPGSSMAFIKA